MDTNAADVGKKEVDNFTKAIGECGRWQIMILLVVVTPIKFMMHWNHLGIIYLAGKTTYRCMETNLTADIKNSTCYEDCTKYEYFEDTIISQWGLICEESWLVSFAQTIYMFGVLVGSIFFGIIADRFGRRPALQYSSLLKLLACFVTPFCTRLWFFNIVRFLTGFASAGGMMCGFVILMEVVGPNIREIMSVYYGIPLSLGHAVMPLFGYYLESWNTYALGIAIPHLFFLVYIFYMPESPKWLISVGKLEEACVVMTKAAKMNKLPTENMKDVVELLAKEANRNIDTKKKASIIDLVRVSKWRMMTLCSCLMWFFASLCYFGTNQLIGQIGPNPFITVALVGLIDVPGLYVASWLAKKLGRRPALLILCVLICVGCGFLALPDYMVTVQTTLGVIGVACTAGMFSLIYLFTSEVFPTVARNMAMGSSSMTSRVGSMLAPFAVNLDVSLPWVPPTIFAVAALIVAALVMCLPETRGKKLEDHLED